MNKARIWLHIWISVFLLLVVIAVFFGTFYAGDRAMASSASFIMFAVLLVITFTAYKSKYKVVPSKRHMKRFKGDYESFNKSQEGKGREAFVLIMIYLPTTLITLMISLLITYA